MISLSYSQNIDSGHRTFGIYRIYSVLYPLYPEKERVKKEMLLVFCLNKGDT